MTNGLQSDRNSQLGVVNALLILSLFICSGDIFFVLKLGGTTLRFAQLFHLGAAFLFLCIRGTRLNFVYPPGFSFLFVFWAMGVAFLPNAPFFTRNLGYLFSFTICVLGVLVYTSYYGSSQERARLLVRWYLYSYAFVAGFGIFQFAAGLTGRDILVSQWFIANRLPRVNGFSYEPSYYALYIMAGLATTFVLWETKSDILPRRYLRTLLILLCAALVVSTSRSGLLGLYIMLAIASLRWTWHFFRGQRGSGLKLAIATCVLGTPVLAFAYVIIRYPTLAFILLNGTGLMGTATHSVSDRYFIALQTLSLAREHLLVGVSFGGVGPSLAENLNPGVTIEQFNMAKTEGLNPFVEVIAETGMAGALAFIAYLFSLSLALLNKRYRQHDLFNVACALTAGLVMEIFLLLAEQNIVRVYLWIHIAVLSAVLFVVKKETVPAPMRMAPAGG